MLKKQTRVAIISHSFVIPENRKRWEHLASDPGFEVHLLMPEYWEVTWFNEKVVYKSERSKKGRFHLHPLPTTSVKNWRRYLFKSIDAEFQKIKPDIIYIVHEEGVLVHQQIYLYRKLFAPSAKIIFFSMNARGVPGISGKNSFRAWLHRFMWSNVKKNTEAALVHYPGCVESLTSAGYSKPIYIQTQVGVNEELFCENAELRAAYRRKIGFSGKLVIGYTGRLIADKGVDDIFEVFTQLAKQDQNIALLLVGNGELREHVERAAQTEGMSDRVYITGFVDQADVPAYMNAMDIAVLGSKTMPHWIDTFPLVTVQAQAIKVPVLASNSASIPWQLADSALIFREGNRDELKEKMLEYIDNKAKRIEYGLKGYVRSREYFCHEGMTENFKKILNQVLTGQVIFQDHDEKYVQWKACR